MRSSVRLLPGLPVRWSNGELRLGTRSAKPAHHVPLLIYPNPRNPRRYVILNSGPTFREAHDCTNSLQNPKLPDWAIVDLRALPDATAPGEVTAAGFFDERWRHRGEGGGEVSRRD